MSDQVRQSRQGSVSGWEVGKVVDEIVDQLLCQVVIEGESRMPKPRQCHHCHRPLNHPEHVGIGSGVNQCTLEHFELCPGGRKTGSDWSGCPAITTDVDTEDEEDKMLSTLTPTNSFLDEQIGDTVKKVDPSVTAVTDLLDPEAVTRAISLAASKAENVHLDDFHGDDESSDDEEDRILEAELAKLRIQEKEEEARLKVEKKAKKMLARQRMEQEKADLLRKAKARQKSDTPSLVQVTRSSAENQLSAPAQPNATTAADHLHRKAADLAAKRQQQAADHRRDKQSSQTDQLTIAAIRSLPGMTPEVEQLLTSLQSMAPTLARAPTAPSASGQTFQPGGVASVQSVRQVAGGGEFDTGYVFNPVWGKYVQVVHSPVRDSAASLRPAKEKVAAVRPDPHALPDSGDETSADDDCPIEPQPGYQFVWRRDALGEKYFTQKLAKKRSSPEMVLTYVCDEDTGRWYKRSVPKADLDRSRPALVVSKANALTKQTYVDHRKSEPSPLPEVKRGMRTPTSSAPLPSGERMPGIVPIDPEKQGKDNKIPDRVQWAKNCPVNWTNKVTSANINVVLWAWSYIADFLQPVLVWRQTWRLEKLRQGCNIFAMSWRSLFKLVTRLTTAEILGMWGDCMIVRCSKKWTARCSLGSSLQA